jgi:O-antigen ligase
VIIVVGLALLIACAWSLSNPFVAMITLMGINIIEPGQLYPVFAAIHVERVMAIVGLIVLFARGYRFAYPVVTKRCLYFYGACLASIPLAFWVGNAVSNAIDFGKVIILHLLYVALVTTRRRMRIVLAAFSCLIGYLCVTSLMLYFQGVYQHAMDTDRIKGLAGSATAPDSLALTLVTAMPLIYLLTRRGSGGWTRALMAIILALSVWTMLLAGARGVFYTFILILLLGILISRRRMLLLPAAVGLVLVLWAVLPAQYQARYSSVDNLSHDMSYQNRVLSWVGGVHMFLHNPITGIGIGDYTFANGARYWPAPRKIYLNAHSLYFETLGELGLVGVITFIGFVAAVIGTNNRVRRRLRTLDLMAREGKAGAEAVPEWLRLFPTACTLSIIGLIYCGYGYHDLYRSTWYFLAAATAAADIITARELKAVADAAEAAPETLPPACGAAG